jgi:hypothetical protein
MLRVLTLVLAAVTFGTAHSDELIELSESNYKKYGAENALVILQINWGRKWECGQYENAQIQRLSFMPFPVDSQLGTDGAFELESPSRLFVKDEFVPYAYIVKPGRYALAGFDIKVARSPTDVGHLVANKTNLLKDGKAVGGTFTATKGEGTYIGHFGLDCHEEPIPWRYHIDGREEFEKYVSGFRKRFPFVQHVPVSFKLFSTETLGQPYSLGEDGSAVQ